MREMIERALGLVQKRAVCSLDHIHVPATLDAIEAFKNVLAEQAIVIECEVEHTEDLGQPYTVIVPTRGWLKGFLDFGNERGHFGTPGKALAIILPLEKK